MVIACETCQDFWQLSWEPNYQLQRETGKTCCQRAAGQREWGTVSWPHHQPPSCFTRARHINTTGIIHVCYLELDLHVLKLGKDLLLPNSKSWIIKGHILSSSFLKFTQIQDKCITIIKKYVIFIFMKYFITYSWYFRFLFSWWKLL